MFSVVLFSRVSQELRPQEEATKGEGWTRLHAKHVRAKRPTGWAAEAADPQNNQVTETEWNMMLTDAAWSFLFFHIFKLKSAVRHKQRISL